jgi:integrase
MFYSTNKLFTLSICAIKSKLLDMSGLVSPTAHGHKHPYRPDSILSSVIRPALARSGIQKHVGWHTFRDSFSTILIGNGENVKAVQELMRHSNCRCTLEIYSEAMIQAKRDAQHRVIQMIVPWKEGATEAQVP